MNDNLIIDGKEFSSRLFIGTGKHRSLKELKDYIISTESEMITVAIRRLDFDDKNSNDLMNFLKKRIHFDQYKVFKSLIDFQLVLTKRLLQ